MVNKCEFLGCERYARRSRPREKWCTHHDTRAKRDAAQAKAKPGTRTVLVPLHGWSVGETDSTPMMAITLPREPWMSEA